MPASCNKHTQEQTAVDAVLVRELRRHVFPKKYRTCDTRGNKVQHKLAYSKTMCSKSTPNERLLRGFVDRRVACRHSESEQKFRHSLKCHIRPIK